ncbi:Saposin B-type domain-containing protein [Mycena sanguinolenta]|uniref:Saposin B-type domain-containing protein n=1 Tax=Mycena sanguinolenta TaxID=230812 RepID=A0A8H6XYI1_9AGAR|nr:Saposin B-type domain-containing protein [Mycena sanguinolenta]
MSAFSSPIPGIDGNLGAILIGGVLGTFLFGIATLQTYNYYNLYPTDSTVIKVLVSSIWLIELGHTIGFWHAFYQLSVTYGQLAHILPIVEAPHSLVLTILFAGLINLLVQTFFAYRIRTLSGKWLMPIICCILTTARFAFDIIMFVFFWTSAAATTAGTPPLQKKAYRAWNMISVLSLGLAADVFIAASMCFYLWKIRSTMSHFQQTRNTVDTLIVWCVETTTLTSATSVLQLIFFLARPDLVWMTFFLIQPKLITNSILAHLNGRERFRQSRTAYRSDTSHSGRIIADDSLAFRAGASTEIRRDTDSYPRGKL